MSTTTLPAGTIVQFRSRVSRRTVFTATVLPDTADTRAWAFVPDYTVSQPTLVRITEVSDFASDVAALPVDTTPAPGLCRVSPLPDNPVWLVAAARLHPVATPDGDVAVQCANGAVVLVDPSMA